MIYSTRCLLTLIGLITGLSVFALSPADGPASQNELSVPFLNAVPLPGGGANLENLWQMQPLGNINGPHHIPAGHFYLDLFRQGQNPTDHSQQSIPTNLKSPGYVKLIMVRKYVDQPDNVVAYMLTFKIAQNTYLYLDHLNALDPAIDSVVQTAINANPNGMWIDLNGIELQPGQNLGSTTSIHALSVGAYDVTYAAPFVQPGLYSPNYAAVAAQLPGFSFDELKIILPSKAFKKLPLDYFSPTARDLLLSYNPRVIGPRGGEIAQDIPDRATGSWLPMAWNGNLPVYGVESDESQALSLSHDSVDPTQPAFAVGSSVPLTDADGTTVLGTVDPGAYFFDVDSNPADQSLMENWSFSNIPVGNGVYCYKNLRHNPGESAIPNLVILVQMRSQVVSGVVKTVLRVQARQRSDAPAVWDRNLNNPLVAEYFRD